MSGPLPQPTRRRNNPPVLPTTLLPAEGRPGPIPTPPPWVRLEKSGRQFWRWAWALPQAAAWSEGDLPVVARRASLEDTLAAQEAVNGLDLIELLDDAGEGKLIRLVIRQLGAVAGGRLGVMKEMRELDDRLGLSPKGLAQLRWRIAPAEDQPSADAGVAVLDDYRAMLGSG